RRYDCRGRCDGRAPRSGSALIRRMAAPDWCEWLAGDCLSRSGPDLYAVLVVRREYAHDLADGLGTLDSARGRCGGRPFVPLPTRPARRIYLGGGSAHSVRCVRCDAGRPAEARAGRGRPRVGPIGCNQAGSRENHPPLAPRIGQEMSSVSLNVSPSATRAQEGSPHRVVDQSFARRGFFEDAFALLSFTNGLLRSIDRSIPRILNGSLVSGPGLDRFFRSFELS